MEKIDQETKKFKNNDLWLNFESSVKYCDLEDFLKGSICKFYVSKVCKKRVHGNGRTTLP